MPPASHVGLLRPRVLIVAELSLPQCKKYRVDQKHDMIEALGWDCTVVAWQKINQVLTLMQTHSVVIFYRVPAFPEILPIIQEADLLGLPHYFELDDLIFDLDDYAANPNLIGLDPATTRGLFDGARLYRRTLELCRNAIASTPYLGGRMHAVGGGSFAVIENALDAETLHAATTARPRRPDGKIRIIYGSGTRTHDADFALIANALKRVLTEHADVEIVLVGDLNPPSGLLEFKERLRRLPACPYAEYLALLADSDIAIAPLIAGNFNDAKSNIKFLEAASVGVPSVCSPRSAFAQAIQHGETGFLAASVDDWYSALTSLVTDQALRQRVGQAARQAVLECYSPEAIGHRQVKPLLSKHQPTDDSRLHILQVNILCSPQTFGGATVVSEEMTQRLNSQTDTRVSIVTSAPAGWLKPYALERSEVLGVPVIRIGIQDNAGWMQAFWDEEAGDAFREALRALRPDVVHFHAIQGLGAACLTACRDEGIPFVVTLHDAWWVCERQFLVTGEGKYCGQKRIDANVCATCVPDIGVSVLRNLRLRQALESADLLLAPSQHWRRFYIANGFAAERVVVNENGIPLPSDPKPNEGPARLRFGFVAGAEAVKGFPLLKRTFEALDRDDWELVLVNHGLSMGLDSYAGVEWNARGSIRTIPPFKAEGRDSFYDSIDVLLFPSQWPESFGLTVREALVRNKWVIATGQGGAAEAITPGVNGTLIPIGDDIAPFRKAIEDLLDRKPDLAGWINPFSARTRDFSAQAAELRGILDAVASSCHSQPVAVVAAVA
jgi:glycosyltransferase involved in cell wall biosynthesis